MEITMRTNIEIDDKIMQEAMSAGGFTSKKATVEAGLRLLAQRHKQRNILKLFGKIEFDPAYDHKKMRESKIK
jgi:Arc/MetJ family transcription regulator